MKVKNYNFTVSLNILGLLGITIPLYVAFYYQLVHHELPCPLCILQRIGLAAAGLGFLFNIYRVVHYSHYAMVVVSALLAAAVAIRQIFLHILPGDVGYGSTLFGLHFYTWVFITSIALILAVLGMVVLSELSGKALRMPSLCKFKSLVTVLFVFVLVANVLSTLLECGLEECDANPTHYIWLSK